MGDNDSCILQTYQREKETQPCGRPYPNGRWNRLNNQLSNPQNIENQKEHPSNEDHSESCLPAMSFCEHDHVGKIDGERQARRQNKGIVGKQTHQQGRDSRSDKSSAHHSAKIHPRI